MEKLEELEEEEKSKQNLAFFKLGFRKVLGKEAP